MTTGINETKEMAVALAKLSVAIIECIETGKFDLLLFLPAISILPDAIKNAGQIPEELKDINSAEFKELCDAVLVELKPLGVPADLIGEYVQAAVLYMDATFALIKAIRDTKGTDVA